MLSATRTISSGRTQGGILQRQSQDNQPWRVVQDDARIHAERGADLQK